MASRRHLISSLLSFRTRPPSLLTVKQVHLTIPTQLPPRHNFCSYKSSISLDKLYPGSGDYASAYSTTPAPPKNEPTKFSGFIPMERISITYTRSSGPGGMNVNKLNTKATVKFTVSEADWIPELIRKNFIDKFRNQITKEGEIQIQSDRTRYQHLNTADALQKLREMIRSCEPVEQVISVEGTEKARRLRERAARERLVTKRRRGVLKSSRGAV